MANDLADVAHVERTPLLEGKNMSQIMGPLVKPGEARKTDQTESPDQTPPATAAAPVETSPASA
jgi:hypothetical protein